jgi:hypothetical protein
MKSGAPWRQIDVTLNRRSLIGLSAASAVALAVGGRVAMAKGATGEIHDNALAYFGKLGFAELPPLSMITGDDFNDGLRYDETRPETVDYDTITVQTSARIDDIAEKDRPGVLAGFTIIGLQSPPDAEPGALVRHVMNFLIEERMLDPAKLRFISTELFRPHLESTAGVITERFFERPLSVARAAGDGSGFFAPKGHPQNPELPTVGVYYPLPETADDTKISYPPDGFIEIAEIGLHEPGNPRHLAAGIGLERVAMAEGEELPDFDETRLNLLRVIEDEARRTGKPLPPGYTKFASL